MNFIVSSATLLKHLQQLSGVLNNSNVLPILDNFLFEIKDGTLTVTASDLESTMTAQVAVKADKDGSIAIPAKMLSDIVKSFPELPLAFTIDTGNYGIEISAGEGKYRLAGFDGADFPRIQSLSDGKTISLPSQVLATAIQKTIFAAGNDEMRPQMNGIFFQLEPDNCTFVATDAHKLVRYRRNDLKSAESDSFIVPRKPLNLLKNILSALDTDVILSFNSSNAFFSFGDIRLACRLVDGKYPNYQAVIPQNNPNKLTVDRILLLNSARRISLFSNKSTSLIRVKITGSELGLSAEDYDFNNSANERITCNYSGEDMEIGFNARFMVEMLQNLDSENVILELSAPNRAGILLPEVQDASAEEILMLVMPIMLNS
ncbi:MAG: DNA polymerase III subunit beta [Bacteroidota bacterium]|jgi:DNA polymerase-3 subunit beta